MHNKLELISGLHQCMKALQSALELRQNAQLTNGVVDRTLCDSIIGHSATTMKEIVKELNSL